MACIFHRFCFAIPQTRITQTRTHWAPIARVTRYGMKIETSTQIGVVSACDAGVVRDAMRSARVWRWQGRNIAERLDNWLTRIRASVTHYFHAAANAAICSLWMAASAYNVCGNHIHQIICARDREKESQCVLVRRNISDRALWQFPSIFRIENVFVRDILSIELWCENRYKRNQNASRLPRRDLCETICHFSTPSNRLHRILYFVAPLCIALCVDIHTHEGVLLSKYWICSKWAKSSCCQRYRLGYKNRVQRNAAATLGPTIDIRLEEAQFSGIFSSVTLRSCSCLVRDLGASPLYGMSGMQQPRGERVYIGLNFIFAALLHRIMNFPFNGTEMETGDGRTQYGECCALHVASCYVENISSAAVCLL